MVKFREIGVDKMKKILIVIMTMVFALGLTFSLTGCGEKGDAYDYQSISGDYQDSVSQRATASFIANEDGDSIDITVYWSNSASSTEVWTINAVIDGEKLSYNKSSHSTVTYSEDGEASESKSKGGAGYFEIGDDGEMLWTGAADEQCRECVFVMAQD